MRADPVVDADGFRTVVYRRRARDEARLPRRPRRLVPADLVGRCFNCLATDHVASRCTQPSRCLRCEQVGHMAKNCKRPRFPGPPRGRGRPTRRFVPTSDVAAAANIQSRCHSAASASTASSGSASTGRAYSGPPSICAASPVSFHGAILHVVRNSSPDSTPLCRPDACMLCYWYDLLYLG